MSINGFKITAPVSAHEPYKVLGVAQRANGYDVGYINSNAHGKTNRWSYRKPVRQPSIVGELTEAQFCAEDGNFGLSIPSGSSDLKTLYKAESWQYLPPNRSTDWMRLLDWDGYNHAAIPPIASGWKPGQEMQLDLFQGGIVAVGASTPGVQASGKRDNLTLQDFKNGGGNLFIIQSIA